MVRMAGEKPKESRKGLYDSVLMNSGVPMRPRRMKPKSPRMPTLALRDQNESPAKRPASPVSMRMKCSSVTMACRPPPRSSVARKPRKLVAMRPDATCSVRLPPLSLKLPTLTSAMP